MGNKLFKKILMSEFDEQPQGGPMDGGKMHRRNETYLTDSVGAISTVLSITAGLNNWRNYRNSSDQTDEWKQLYMTELLWSGVIESSAIALVLVTDSNLLRAIGGFSMLGVNTTGIYLSNRAMDVEYQTSLRTSL